MARTKAVEATRCPACRGSNVRVQHPQFEAVHKGHKIAFVDEISVCGDCNEEFYTYEQSLSNSRAWTSAVRDAERLISPDQIREARRRLGMTQGEFEGALGVGKKTVARWERGTVVPGGAANGLLWLARHHPAVFLAYAGERQERSESQQIVEALLVTCQGPPGALSPITFVPSGPVQVGRIVGRANGSLAEAPVQTETRNTNADAGAYA